MVKYRAMCDDTNLGEFDTKKEAQICIQEDKKAMRKQYMKTQKELDNLFTWDIDTIEIIYQ